MIQSATCIALSEVTTFTKLHVLRDEDMGDVMRLKPKRKKDLHK